MSEREDELSTGKTIETNLVGNMYLLDDAWEKICDSRERFMNSLL